MAQDDREKSSEALLRHALEQYWHFRKIPVATELEIRRRMDSGRISGPAPRTTPTENSPKMDEHTFAPGDVVRLKSGSPDLTVVRVYPWTHGPQALVTWFDLTPPVAVRQTADIPVACLQLKPASSMATAMAYAASPQGQQRQS